METELRASAGPDHVDALVVNGREVPLLFVRNPRARRYLLRVRRDGRARVTIPRGGSLTFARSFAHRNVPWLEKALRRLSAEQARPTIWSLGSEVLFRGELLTLAVADDGMTHSVRLGDQTIKVSDTAADLRPAVEARLKKLACNELTARVIELASQCGEAVVKITIRNQRSRWGSCSRRRTISLNWRLIQTPAYIRDYIILHELMHLRQMNHSARFWKEVERVCPDYEVAEKWLKQHAWLLRSSV